jgi:hypothetical protein
MARRIGLALALILVPSALAQPQTRRSEEQVRQTLAKFIRAFDDLDWERFRLAFDDNATAARHRRC